MDCNTTFGNILMTSHKYSILTPEQERKLYVLRTEHGILIADLARRFDIPNARVQAIIDKQAALIDLE